MKTNHGFGYAFNAQAAVDEDHQIVLAADVTQQATDVQQLIPMTAPTTHSLKEAGIGQRPQTILADAGHCSNNNLTAADRLGSLVLIATGRQHHDERFPTGAVDGPPPPGAT